MIRETFIMIDYYLQYTPVLPDSSKHAAGVIGHNKSRNKILNCPGMFPAAQNC
jgi:hypothetical protein